MNPRQSRPMAIPLLSLDIETFQKYKEIPGTYSAEAQVKVYQRLTATLPLKVGSVTGVNWEN